MRLLMLFSSICLVHGGVIGEDHAIQHHERATSYQNIHFEHFHAVPTYIKKEDKHLLEHPISIGTSSSKVEIHHGDKHDHGYALASAENNVHGHGFGGFEEGLKSHLAGQEAAGADYQVHDQGEYQQGHLGQESLGEEAAQLEYQGHYGHQSLGEETAKYQYPVAAGLGAYGGLGEGHVPAYSSHES